MKRYPKYKDSGVEWIGEVPEHWAICPIKGLATGSGTLFIDGDWIESKNLSSEGVRYITTGNVGEGSYKEQGSGFISEATFHDLKCTEVLPGDVLISRLNPPIGRSCIVPDLKNQIITSVDNVILRPNANFDPRFVVYRFSAGDYFHELSILGSGATMQRVARSDLGHVRVAWPPRAEQSAIADALDRETTRIDALIAKKSRFIELLKEKRQALITHAVTKGLDPKAKMKDSGVEWIGDVPEHWRVCQLKHLGRLKGGAGFPPDLQGISGNEIAFYKVSDLAKSEDGINLGNTENTLTEAQTRALGANIFDTGTLAWAKIGAALSLNRRRVVSRRCCLDNNMTGFIVDRLVGSVIYSFYLMTIVDFSIHAKPGAVPSFSEGDQGELKVPCPPLNEQELIAQSIEISTTRIDLLTQKIQHSIDLLKERRSAFITAAVTGQIDLRGSP